MFSPFDVVLKTDIPALGPVPFRVYATVIPDIPGDAREFDWLTQAEAVRAAAIARPERRAQFVTGRWLLRDAAARVFGENAYRLDYVDGKPLVGATDGRPAALSLSHSAELIVCAAGHVQALGVDVERIRPRGDWNALAAWSLHPSERERLEGAREAQRWRSFYQAWTFKEALAKALGVGVFGLAFNRIAVSEDGLLEQTPQDVRLRKRDWRLCPLSVGEGFAAAVAWRA
jgi:4'-phosphopantetheinyl transferase